MKSNIFLEILSRTPESVLDIGGGNGEVVKFLEEKGIKSVCMDNSEECQNNKITNNFILHNILDMPWSFADKQFDLCTGFGVLKYIPDEKLVSLFHEIARVTQRGFFGVGRGIKAPTSECKIKIVKPVGWWIAKFAEFIPSYPVEVLPMRGSIIGIDALRNRSPVKDYWRPE